MMRRLWDSLRGSRTTAVITPLAPDDRVVHQHFGVMGTVTKVGPPTFHLFFDTAAKLPGAWVLWDDFEFITTEPGVPSWHAVVSLRRVAPAQQSKESV